MYIFAYLAANPLSPLAAAFVEFQIVRLPQLTLYQTSSNKTNKNFTFGTKLVNICEVSKLI